MRALGNCIMLLCAALILISCAPRAPELILSPVTPLTGPLEYPGFSVNPPRGDDWSIWENPPQSRADYQLYFGKKTSNRKHTILARVFASSIPSTSEASAEILDKYVRGREQESKTGRYRPLRFKTSAEKFQGADCVRYESSAEDRGVPQFPDTVFLLKVYSMVCLHPDFPSYLIEIGYSQRTPQGMEPAKIGGEAKRFLAGLQFTSLGARIKLIAVGRGPQDIAVTKGAVWVANINDHTVSRLDPASNKVVATIAVGEAPVGVAASENAVWVANKIDGTVSRIDPETNRVIATIAVGKSPFDIALGAGSLWVANNGSNSISRIDPESSSVIATISVGKNPTGVAEGKRAMWVTNFGADTVSRIDPATNKVVALIRVGNGPTLVFVDNGVVWVTNQLGDSVSRIDPATNRVTDTITVGSRPVGLAVTGGMLWVANNGDNTLTKIDIPRNHVVGGPIPVGRKPLFVAAGKNALWVGNFWDGNIGTVSRIDLR